MALGPCHPGLRGLWPSSVVGRVPLRLIIGTVALEHREKAWMVGAGQEDEPSIKDAPLKTGKNSGVVLQAGSVLSP